MEDIFISEINVEKARVVKDLSIPLSDSERKHLIITGKNGSGKTSVLFEIKRYLDSLLLSARSNQDEIANKNITFWEKKFQNKQVDSTILKNVFRLREMVGDTNYSLNGLGAAQVKFKHEYLLWEKIKNGTFIIVYFDANRRSEITIPGGINKIDLKQKYDLKEQANQSFIQYIVNLKADRSFAKDDGEDDVVASIDKWFDNFEERLRDIFSSPSLKLKFDRKTYNFQIIEAGKEPYNFNTLSDGYSAIISIVTELILRMEAHEAKNFDMEGLVLIDEIETHLHVELQKKILPFLIDFFPKIQFIVSTHSPFVLSSVENSVICDLESRIVTSDLSAYSYDAIIESYFNADKYSDAVKDKILEYEQLALSEELDSEKKYRLKELEKYFSHVPKYLSKELLVKLQEIQLKRLSMKKS